MVKRLKKAHHSRRKLRRVGNFLVKNGQLLFLLLLVFFGAMAATLLYPHLSDEWTSFFCGVADHQSDPASITQGLTAVISSAFFVFVLLTLLFLFGLTPYGWPLILCVPLFFGYVLGLLQCRMYLVNGLTKEMFLSLIPTAFSSLAVLIGAAQSLQMSALFSRQLLPGSAHCGGLWQDFKLYLLRFLLCVLLAFAASAVKILLQYIV